MAVLEMKNCKECGKLFRPKSKNSVYCDDLHFRPCPVCGKPVEAKYLSDPARCCSNECKAQYRRSNTNPNHSIPSTVMNKIVNDLRSADDGRRFPQQGRNNKALFALGSNTVTNAPKVDEVVPADVIPMPKPKYVVPKLPQVAPDTEFAAMLRSSADVRTYIGVPVLGFIPGHEYALEINKDDRNILYIIEASYDFTEGKEVDHCIHMASQISIHQNFAKDTM